MPTRRAVLKTGIASLAFGGLSQLLHADPPVTDGTIGYGPLQPDPEGILDLPAGFRATRIGVTGERMTDGLPTPGRPDGMAAFALAGGMIGLICNHELDPGNGHDYFRHPQAQRIYDKANNRRPGGGGTTTIIYNPKTGQKEQRWLSLAGTVRNCAGGATPWGSWLSCEESVFTKNDKDLENDHGYIFEVPLTEKPYLHPALPLTAMGRFNHEAAAVHPSGVIYLSEDRGDGLFYRFIPKTPGKLADGGSLQALVIRDQPSVDTGKGFTRGTSFTADWINLDDVTSPKDDLRHRGRQAGAAVFRRGEGLWMGADGSCWLTCTSGGIKGFGQVWRYIPSAVEGTSDEQQQPAQLELIIDSQDSKIIRYPDNITISPWGDALVAEDGPPGNRLLGVTPQGQVYPFAKNVLNGSELAGICFAPDGKTAFVNIQNPGVTLAIQGPFAI